MLSVALDSFQLMQQSVEILIFHSNWHMKSFLLLPVFYSMDFSL